MKTYRFVTPRIIKNDESSRREFLATLLGYGSALLFGHAAGAQIRSEYKNEYDETLLGESL